MIKIRAAKEKDAETLCKIQKAAFLPIYELYHDAGNPCLRGAEDIARRLDSPFFRYFTILENDEIVGGIFYKCAGRTPFSEGLEAGEYYLQRLYIDPERQNRGIARTAILLCEKEFPDAKKFSVDFPKELEKNRRCYTHAGFRDTGKELEAEPGLVLASFEKQLNAKGQ